MSHPRKQPQLPVRCSVHRLPSRISSYLRCVFPTPADYNSGTPRNSRKYFGSLLFLALAVFAEQFLQLRVHVISRLRAQDSVCHATWRPDSPRELSGIFFSALHESLEVGFCCCPALNVIIFDPILTSSSLA